MAVGNLSPSREAYQWWEKPGYIHRLWFKEDPYYEMAGGVSPGRTTRLDSLIKECRDKEDVMLSSLAIVFGEEGSVSNGEKILVSVADNNMKLNELIYNLLYSHSLKRGVIDQEDRDYIRTIASTVVDAYLSEGGYQGESNQDTINKLQELGSGISELINDPSLAISNVGAAFGNLYEIILSGLLQMEFYKGMEGRGEEFKDFIFDTAFTGSQKSGRGNTKKTFDVEVKINENSLPIQVKAHYSPKRLNTIDVITNAAISNFLSEDISQSEKEYLSFALVHQHVLSDTSYLALVNHQRDLAGVGMISGAGAYHAIETLAYNSILDGLQPAYSIMKESVIANFIARLEEDNKRTLVFLNVGHEAGSASVIRVSQILSLLEFGDNNYFRFRADDNMSGITSTAKEEFNRHNGDYSGWYNKTAIPNILDKIKVTMTFNYGKVK